MERSDKPLKVIGLGPGNVDWIPRGNIDALKSASIVLLRTEIHPSTKLLLDQGIDYRSCDDLYQTCSTFEDLYHAIASRAADLDEDAVFAVPGHPMVGEESVRILAGLRQLQVFPAPSFVDAILASAGESFSGSLHVWNAHDSNGTAIDPRSSQIVYQLDSAEAASDAKLTLMKYFPEEHQVILVSRAGGPEELVQKIALSELDRREYDPLTSAYVPPVPSQFASGFNGLVEVVDALLGPDGCPWDREQTHESLKKHMVEETYEVLEAIDSGDPDALCEELGDFLLQAVMHAQMDAITGYYDIYDVVQGIKEKLIRRHPHVFGDVQVADSDEVLSNWDAIKKSEKQEDRSVLSGIPKAMPALLRAHEVSKRAVRVGFEWKQLEDVFAKMREEIEELRGAIESGSQEEIEGEVGDLLFTVVNISRWLKVEPEEALRKMVDRFSTRFIAMEKMSTKPLNELSFEEWDELWNLAKSLPE